MDDLECSREALIQALGRQSAFWGLGRTAGEMYAALYLSPEPLSLAEVAARLAVTKGNISVAIRQLERLGMVRRSWRKGDRRVFFEAETDFWRIAHDVLRRRHKPEFDQSFDLVAESVRLAQEAPPSAEREAALGRLARLQEFYRLLDGVAEVLLALRPEELKAAVEMFRLLASRKMEDQA